MERRGIMTPPEDTSGLTASRTTNTVQDASVGVSVQAGSITGGVTFYAPPRIRPRPASFPGHPPGGSTGTPTSHCSSTGPAARTAAPASG